MGENLNPKVWFLIIRSSNERLQEFTLQPGKNTLGRDSKNDIVLYDNAASTNHAEIHFDHVKDTLTLSDLASTNGTFVNGRRIHKPVTLQHEDQIRVGFCLITIIHSDQQSNLKRIVSQERTKVTSELILESVDNYGVLLHDVGQRLVNVTDLNNALFEISELIERMVGAEECQILLADQFDKLNERGIPADLAKKIIDGQSATLFSYPVDNPASIDNKNRTLQTQSMLMVPVIINDIVVALIFAKKSKTSSKVFFSSDLQLVLAVSNQVAMSIQRNRIEGKLLHTSTHDSLTDLPNRNLFLERLQHLLDHDNGNHDRRFAVLFFDIDDFKIVNDSLGHSAGDKLLVAIAERLKHNVRNFDILTGNTLIARFGGDEFAILLENIIEDQAAIAIANRLKTILSRPFNINNKEIYTTVSIGVAVSRQNYEHPEDLLRDADMAMYEAKELGKDRVAVFDTAMHERVIKRMQMGTALRQGALQKEFRLHYQPIISLNTGGIVGFEALLRWYTEDGNILIPGDFMHAIDTAGLTYSTDQWVLDVACQQALAWQKKYPQNAHPFVSVNLSARNIKHPNLVKNISKLLHDLNLNPNRLWVEITEQVSAASDASVISVLKDLRSLGVRISLDDFGTGYSALNYLAQFPIDALKIDRSFINLIGINNENLKIIELLKALASHLGLILIAEGVEHADQIPFLQSIQCEYVQGFFYAHPVDAESANQLLVHGL